MGYDQPRTIIGNGYAAELAVPLWGRFMMAATRSDKPDWFSPPVTVTSATICRLSGKLATDGCSGVAVLDKDGNTTVKSMVYTDYFVRGTEPVDYCPLHDHGYGEEGIVATAGVAPETVPVPRPASPLAAVAAAAAPVEASPAALPPTPSDRVTDPRPAPPARGFWSRFFRRGDPGAGRGEAPPDAPPPESAPTPSH